MYNESRGIEFLRNSKDSSLITLFLDIKAYLIKCGFTSTIAEAEADRLISSILRLTHG